jgi:hypothetical protein
VSFFGDVLGFEKFHASDLLERTKDDPKRLILGVDPLSTKAWNKVLGRDDEPLVDQMGGPYAGHTIGGDEGVFERARAEGIDTGPGKGMHDIAHVVAAIYAGQGLTGLGTGQNPFGFGGEASSQVPGATPGINPAANPNGGAFGGFDWQQMMQMMPQQQENPEMPPIFPQQYFGWR